MIADYFPMSRLIHTAVCAAAITGVVIFAAQISAAQETVGAITKVSGIANLARGGKVLDAIAAMPVAIGDQFRTMRNAQMSVTFSDGSRAELGELSSFTIDRYSLSGPARKSALLELWGGKLRTIVKTATASAPSFEVHTPNAVAAVRGTDFETAYVMNRPCPEDHTCTRYTTVGVSKGIVAVSNPGNPAPPTAVREGYETTVACESAATSPAPLGMEDLGAPGYH